MLVSQEMWAPNEAEMVEASLRWAIAAQGSRAEIECDSLPDLPEVKQQKEDEERRVLGSFVKELVDKSVSPGNDTDINTLARSSPWDLPHP